MVLDCCSSCLFICGPRLTLNFFTDSAGGKTDKRRNLDGKYRINISWWQGEWAIARSSSILFSIPVDEYKKFFMWTIWTDYLLSLVYEVTLFYLWWIFSIDFHWTNSPMHHSHYIYFLFYVQVIAVKADLAKIQLTSPVCTRSEEKITLSRRVDKHWR